MNRTPDLLITNELLYRLSYTGVASDYSLRNVSARCLCGVITGHALDLVL